MTDTRTPTPEQGDEAVDLATCPWCHRRLDPDDPNVTAERNGQLWHVACPEPQKEDEQ